MSGSLSNFTEFILDDDWSFLTSIMHPNNTNLLSVSSYNSINLSPDFEKPLRHKLNILSSTGDQA
jgi:hypothetical protein